MAILNNAIINGSARFIGDVYFNSIATATIASGDKLIIYDGSDPTRIKASLAFGTSTTTYLCNNGSWGTPAGTGGGSQGQRGSLWFTGTVSSFSGTGNVSWTDSSSAHVAGDIYLRSDTYNTYKCTGDANANTASSWTYVCNIKGASGTNGTNGIDGNMIWTTTSSPTTPNYTFTISNLSGPTGATPKIGDIVITSNYRYTITSVSSTTVLTGSRVSIKGAKGDTGNDAVISWVEQTSTSSNYRVALQGTNNTVYYSTGTLEYNPGTGLYLSKDLHMNYQQKIYFDETSGYQSYISRYKCQFSPYAYIQNYSNNGGYEFLHISGSSGIEFDCDKSVTDGGGLKFTPSSNEEYFIMYVPYADLPSAQNSSQTGNGTGRFNAGLYTNYVVPKTGGTYSGNVHAPGFFQNSDINLKNVQDYITLNNSDIAKLPIFDFLWRNKEDENLHSGTSAQEVQKLLPTLVQNGSEGLVLDYATLGSILGINAARELEILKKRVQLLEEYISHGTNSY